MHGDSIKIIMHDSLYSLRALAYSVYNMMHENANTHEGYKGRGQHNNNIYLHNVMHS